MLIEWSEIRTQYGIDTDCLQDAGRGSPVNMRHWKASMVEVVTVKCDIKLEPDYIGHDKGLFYFMNQGSQSRVLQGEWFTFCKIILADWM